MASKKSTRIMCLSDTHGIVDVSSVARKAIDSRVDIVVLAGDIQPCWIAMSADEYMAKEFFPAVYMLRDAGIDVVATPGNHDFWLHGHLDCSRENFHLLVDREKTVKGVRFYGTPWCPTINGRWVFEEYDDDLNDRFDMIPRGIDVLVAHTPPIGFTDDELWDVSTQNDRAYWNHWGSRSLRKAIVNKRPRVVVCGHIHTGDHGDCAIRKIGGNEDTPVFNVSMVDENYELAYRPLVIVIGKKRNMSFRIGGKLWKRQKS